MESLGKLHGVLSRPDTTAVLSHLPSSHRDRLCVDSGRRHRRGIAIDPWQTSRPASLVASSPQAESLDVCLLFDSSSSGLAAPTRPRERPQIVAHHGLPHLRVRRFILTATESTLEHRAAAPRHCIGLSSCAVVVKSESTPKLRGSHPSKFVGSGPRKCL